MYDRVTVSTALVAWGLVAVSAVAVHAQTGSNTIRLEDFQLSGHGRFDIRGQFGDIPTQTPVTERDYAWWVPGSVGFFEYHLEAGGVLTFRERFSVLLALTTTTDRGDRDFTLFGNDANMDVRLKEAGVRLERLWTSRLAIEGGRLSVTYPLFTTYDYTGGRLLFRIRSYLRFDWGQWQVTEGHIVDRPGQGSDDTDLWGPRLRLRTARVAGALYALVNSKAGGRDGISNNVKTVGIDAKVRWRKALTVDATGLVQRGDTSDPDVGSRRVRAWAFRGRARYRFPNGASIGGEYWSGSGDDPGTPKKNEGFQQFDYRNTLEKFTLFYRAGLTDLRLIRGTAQGTAAHVTGRLYIARVGEEASGKWLGTELGVTLEYPYSQHARLRWRFGTTFDGDRMQVFEMSSGFSAP